jgi:hypothetical protein
VNGDPERSGESDNNTPRNMGGARTSCCGGKFGSQWLAAEEIEGLEWELTSWGYHPKHD